MPEQNKQLRLIWIDLEMTGLDTNYDRIIEIATIVTDSELNELATGPELAISTPLSALDAMDAWNTRHHRDSGLWDRCVESDISTNDAEQATLAFLADWVAQGASPMCGNSICQDRRFLSRLMPELEAWFHYRNLDVSTLKELASRWSADILPGFSKDNKHEALSDIRESIKELQFYRQFMGRLGGIS
ncbi:MAG: oligoribonuclease [Xanthomonadales bacterium]|nr:oligoribonuclease [Xanthomonadales bacterium]